MEGLAVPALPAAYLADACSPGLSLSHPEHLSLITYAARVLLLDSHFVPCRLATLAAMHACALSKLLAGTLSYWNMVDW